MKDLIILFILGYLIGSGILSFDNIANGVKKVISYFKK